MCTMKCPDRDFALFALYTEADNNYSLLIACHECCNSNFKTFIRHA